MLDMDAKTKQRNPFVSKPGRPDGTKNMPGKRSTKKRPWADVEELVNLVKNKTGMNDREIQHKLGVSDSNFSTWRRNNMVAVWLPMALKGLLSELGEGINSAPLQIGMRFTNEQLELMNRAMSGFVRHHPDEAKSAKKLRAAILLELASRLDGD